MKPLTPGVASAELQDLSVSNRGAKPVHEPAQADGVLLVGHGTRDPAGIDEAYDLAQQVRQRLASRVELVFLEFAQPTIAEGLARLAKDGVRRLTVIPLMLFAAGHVKRDIPLAVMESAAAFPELEIRWASALECQPSLVTRSVELFREATANTQVDLADTLWLWVGRGSTDPTANAWMAHYARLCFEQAPTGWLELCFTALAEPSIETALPLVAGLPFKQVVVQPHLLFRGRLLDRVSEQVQAQSVSSPQLQWVLTRHLGPDGLVVDALEHAFRAATTR